MQVYSYSSELTLQLIVSGGVLILVTQCQNCRRCAPFCPTFLCTKTENAQGFLAPIRHWICAKPLLEKKVGLA